MTKKRPIHTILGIDPGTRVTGYGIIQTDLTSFTLIDYGAIRPPSKYPLYQRQLIIHEGIAHLIETYPIDALSIETQYVSKNIQSTLKLGMAKGVAILAATKQGIAIFEYAPKKAKIAVAGTGNATKKQVGKMVQLLLNLPEVPEPEDAADALALAFCHSHHIQIGSYL